MFKRWYILVGCGGVAGIAGLSGAYAPAFGAALGGVLLWILGRVEGDNL